jgi:hypothetical protein
MKHQHGIRDTSPRVTHGLADRPVMQAEQRERLAGAKMEIVDDEIAFLASRAAVARKFPAKIPQAIITVSLQKMPLTLSGKRQAADLTLTKSPSAGKRCNFSLRAIARPTFTIRKTNSLARITRWNCP